MFRHLHSIALITLIAGHLFSASGDDAVITSYIAKASPEHPRNSEGDLLVLRDGSLFAAWSQFYDGSNDHAPARIVAVKSTDGGKSWSRPVTLQENVGQSNVMSVSLLRSHSGDVLFFYLLKNSISDLKAYVRRSTDDTQTWSEPVLITPESGYHVMNNARIIQLKSGRLLAPISTCETVGKDHPFRTIVYYSDDDGLSWQRGKSLLSAPKRGAMEPGLIELNDGRVMQIIRTQTGTLWHAFSSDGGDTWSEAESMKVEAPEAPSTIARNPSNGDWLLVLNPVVEWSDPAKTVLGTNHGGVRTPLAVRISRDEGKTWSPPQNIESDPTSTYAYTSITFHEDRVLLSYYDFPLGSKQLSLKFKSLPIAWLPR